jgi:hypothetical protein
MEVKIFLLNKNKKLKEIYIQNTNKKSLLNPVVKAAILLIKSIKCINLLGKILIFKLIKIIYIALSLLLSNLYIKKIGNQLLLLSGRNNNDI